MELPAAILRIAAALTPGAMIPGDPHRLAKSRNDGLFASVEMGVGGPILFIFTVIGLLAIIPVAPSLYLAL